MMNRYGLFGRLQAQPGKGGELAEILLAAAGLMQADPSCILYTVNQEAGAPDTLWVVEVWESQADHDRSLKDPGVRPLISRALPILAGQPEGGVTLEVLGGKGLP